MAGPGNILIKIGADAGQAVRELGTVDKALGSTMSHSEKMSAGLKKAALPAAAALGAIGFAAIDATKAAAEDAAAQEHLAGVMKRTAGATDATVKSTEDWISGISRATGVSDDELRPALESLVTATGSVSKSQKEMKAALDIAAASGKSVTEVTKAMALAHTGQTAKLEKLVPGLSKASKESDDMNTIMAELARTTGGSMAQSTETAAGQFKIFQNQTSELKESLGAALLPVVEALVPVLVELADVTAEHTGMVKIAIGVIAALAAGILVANAAMKVSAAVTFAMENAQKAAAAAAKAWAAAQWLLNAALNANPIGLVLVALAALAAAIYLAYTRSETFRNVVDKAMDVVKDSVNALNIAFDHLKDAAFFAWDWIKDHWKLALFAFGPIGAAVYLISENFDKIKSAATAAKDYLVEAWTVAKFAFGPIATAVNAIANAFKRIWHWAQQAWHAIDDLIGLLGKIKVPKLPHIPGLSMAAPAVAGFGPTAYGVAAGAGRAAAPAGITVNVYGAVDPEGTARAIRRILEGHDRRQGRRI